MKLFRSRGRHEPGSPQSPLDETVRLFTAGRYAEAEAEARRVAATWEWQSQDRVGPLALGVAAMAANAQGRHADALAEYDSLLPVFGEAFGAEHVQTLKLRSDRAQTLSALGRHAECEAECAAVVRSADRGTGRDMVRLGAAARNGLVFALDAQGRYADAEAVARVALASLSDPDLFGQVLRLGLARSLHGQGRHEEALAEVDVAEALYRAFPGTGQERGAVDVVRATVLLGLGRDAEARTLAGAAYETCLAAFGPGHRRTGEARDLLERIDRGGRAEDDGTPAPSA